MSRGKITRSTATTPSGASGGPLAAAVSQRTPPPGRRAYLAPLLCLLFLGSLLPARVFATATEPGHTILFFGDSITAGYGLEDPASEAYPAVVQRQLEAEHRPWRVINAGLSGETSAGGLRRIDWVLRQPVDIFVLALGGNDGLRGIDPAVTQRNLAAIIDRVRAKDPAAKIVVAGMEMPGAMGDAFTRRFHEIFPRIAAQKQATLLPFLLAGVGGHAALNQADAIHPTAAGHRVVAENVWKVLRPLL